MSFPLWPSRSKATSESVSSPKKRVHASSLSLPSSPELSFTGRHGPHIHPAQNQCAGCRRKASLTPTHSQSGSRRVKRAGLWLNTQTVITERPHLGPPPPLLDASLLAFANPLFAQVPSDPTQHREASSLPWSPPTKPRASENRPQASLPRALGTPATEAPSTRITVRQDLSSKPQQWPHVLTG